MCDIDGPDNMCGTGNDKQITSKAASEVLPHVFEDKIVWTEIITDGNTNIYMCDIDGPDNMCGTGNDKKIEDSQNTKFIGDIDSNKIVWLEPVESGILLQSYDLLLETKKTLADINALPIPSYYGPKIYENNIVWADNRNGNQDIFLFDILTNEITQVTTDTNNQREPEIYNNRIIWADERNFQDGYGKEIFIYDIDSQQESLLIPAVTLTIGSLLRPTIYENSIVWQDSRSDKSDIYYVDLNSVWEDYGIIVEDAVNNERIIEPGAYIDMRDIIIDEGGYAPPEKGFFRLVGEFIGGDGLPVQTASESLHADFVFRAV